MAFKKWQLQDADFPSLLREGTPYFEKTRTRFTHDGDKHRFDEINLILVDYRKEYRHVNYGQKKGF